MQNTGFAFTTFDSASVNQRQSLVAAEKEKKKLQFPRHKTLLNNDSSILAMDHVNRYSTIQPFEPVLNV